MRFVILFHELPPESGRASHYDFMLEEAEHLSTWWLGHVPDVVVRQPCNRLADHRLAYLDYEGPVQSVGGVVSQWDAGEYDELETSEEICRVKLRGRRLSGVVTFAQTADQRGAFDFSDESR